MVDPRRTGGIILALMSVAICLAFVEAAVGAARPLWPACMQRDMGFWPYDGYAVAGGQLSAILKEGLSPEEPIGVIVGASTLYLGVDPAQLESVVRPHLRWRRLTVNSATVCELAADMTLSRSLKRSRRLPGTFRKSLLFTLT